ncbi:MAG: TIGR00725 family protein [Fidelibacterota bacterium]
MNNNQFKIAIIGGKVATDEDLQLAYESGKQIAGHGHILICGGRTGIMEAAAKGACEAGGLTIGILPGIDDSDVNPYIKISLPTGIGLARNSIIACAADGAIAISGQYGTLSEIAFCKQFQTPVCSLNSWQIKGVKCLDTAQEALKYIEEELTG